MYFDPGTGSMIIQIVVAAIASIGAFFIAFKDKIKLMFKGSRSKSEKEKK